MKPAIALAAFLVLAGCGEPAPPPPEFASHWFSSELATVNIHETRNGLAGMAREGGGPFTPIRNIALTDTTMSFTVPSLEATWTATKGEDGAWAFTAKGLAETDTFTLKPADAPDLPNRFVTLPDGRWVEMICEGKGSPAVLLDYGAGGSMRVWADTFGPIAKLTRTCMFERSGRGLTDPGPLPRDVNTTVADIDAMLAAAKIDGPVVLAGHSMASYHIRQFANLHADGRAAGLVLIDPSGDGQTARFSAEIPNLKELLPESVDEAAISACVAHLSKQLQTRLDPMAARCGGNDPAEIGAMLSEIASMEVVSTGQIRAAQRPYGDMPLIVLTRGDYDKDMPPSFTPENKAAMARVWTRMHEEMAGQSAVGQHRTVPNAGHFIQGDAPQAVIDAVRDVVAAARVAKP